ncbi:MAG: hypothetical protein CMC18_05775 [Flavobacteriaceae bacterium]|nr:hypothetical protein [Flavobacteriaceae bacterium]
MDTYSLQPFLQKLKVYIPFLSIFCYAFFAHQTQRTALFEFSVLYFLSFALYLCACNTLSLRQITALGILSRIVFIGSTPLLSQDFSRFIWDGYLIGDGINPYQFTPSELIEQYSSNSLMSSLYEIMGGLSQTNYSNYPPFNQFFFYLSSLFNPYEIEALRTVLFTADLGVLWFLQKLMKGAKANLWIGLYFLNPLLIVEGVGNLHFEGVMVFFFAISLWLIQKNKVSLAGLFWSLSVFVKLIPLMFLPLLLSLFKKAENIRFYIVFSVSSIVLLLPLFQVNELLNFWATLKLWFSNFAFNGSLYKIGKFTAENLFNYPSYKFIKTYSAAVSAIIFFTSFYLGIKNRSKETAIKNALLILTLYLFTTSTVHPWYIITLLFLSVLNQQKFVVVWSASIFLSYLFYTGYSAQPSTALSFIIYLPVFAYLIYQNQRIILSVLSSWGVRLRQ